MDVLAGESDGLVILVMMLVNPIERGPVEDAMGPVEESVLNQHEEDELESEFSERGPKLK